MDILVYGFPAVLIVIGLVEIAKKFINERYLPLIAILFGVALASLAACNYWTPEAIVKGIVIGLVSSGLWDFGKHTIAGK